MSLFLSLITFSLSAMTMEAGPAVSMLVFKALEAVLSQKPSIFEYVCPLWEFVFQSCLSLGGRGGLFLYFSLYIHVSLCVLLRRDLKPL